MKQETHTPPGLGAFYSFLLVSGLILLTLIPVATKPAPNGQGWWTEPKLMPAISLVLWVIPAIYLTLNYFAKLRSGAIEKTDQTVLNQELFQWLKPLEFFVYYVIYIVLLGWVGYFLSSLIFVLGLSWRVGLRGRRWRIIALVTSLALILIFRWGLRVWIDSPLLFDLFPREIRLFLSRYF